MNNNIDSIEANTLTELKEKGQNKHLHGCHAVYKNGKLCAYITFGFGTSEVIDCE